MIKLATVIFLIYSFWGIAKLFKSYEEEGMLPESWKVFIGIMVFIALGVAITVLESNELAPTNTDPIYQVNLNGSSPQIVKRYEEGDDIKPNLHTVYYYPELDQYEVVVIMGRDR